MAMPTQLQSLIFVFVLAADISFAIDCNPAEVSRDALDTIFNKRDLSSFDRYIEGPYYQHNPTVSSGTQGLRNFIESNSFPTGFEVYRFFRFGSGGKFGFSHSSVSLSSASTFAVVDIFRFDDDCKIIEHWDVMQPLVEKTVSGNDMFSCLSCNSSNLPPSSCNTIDIGKAVLLGLFNDRNVSLIDTYFQLPYYQHNPTVGNGLDGLRQFISTVQNPPVGPRVVNHRAGSLGNFVFLHNQYFGLIENRSTAAVDIFRFNSECKIVEHWDVLQDVPLFTVSGNDMFSCLSCDVEAERFSQASSSHHLHCVPLILILLLITIIDAICY